MLADTHVHLNDERLRPDASKIVEDFAADNLELAINVGYDLESSRTSVALADAHAELYAAVGIHPHSAKNANAEAYAYFERAAKNAKTVAYGEIGLDYFYDLSDRATQRRVLCEQLELADSLNLPVIFHLRDAYEDMARILKDNRRYLKNSGVLHCYSGSAEMLAVLAPHDLYVAFGGAITFKNARKEEIIRAVPQERLLIETDCPYMTPAPFRGQTNYPKHVNLVFQKMVEILGADAGRLEAQLMLNTKTLFRIY